MPEQNLNPDALTRRDIMAGQIGAWIDEWDDGKADTAHVATHVANRLTEHGITTLATLPAQPDTVIDAVALNKAGWTCGSCEPGDYSECEECQSACDDLAHFLNGLNRPAEG